MRVLTVQQPWAWAIVHAGKNVENRSQLWSYRGPLAIHAGARISQRGMDSSLVGMAARRMGYHSHAPELPLGAIIGVVDMVDAHHVVQSGDRVDCCDSPWAEPWRPEGPRRVTHLVLENPAPLPDLIPCRGRLGLWTPGADVLHALVDRQTPAFIHPPEEPPS